MAGRNIEIGYDPDRFSGVPARPQGNGDDGSGRLQPEDAVTATLADALTGRTTRPHNSNRPAAITADTEVDRDACRVTKLSASTDITGSFAFNAKVPNVADKLCTPLGGDREPRSGGNIGIGA